MCRPIARKLSHKHSDDEMRYSHEHAAPKEQGASTKPVHGPKACANTYELGNIEDTGHDKLHAVI